MPLARCSQKAPLRALEDICCWSRGNFRFASAFVSGTSGGAAGTCGFGAGGGGARRVRWGVGVGRGRRRGRARGLGGGGGGRLLGTAQRERRQAGGRADGHRRQPEHSRSHAWASCPKERYAASGGKQPTRRA